MTEAETIVGSMACLLVVRAVLGSIMRSREILRERPRLQGFKVSPLGKDLKCLRQRHVESVEDPAPSGQVL